MDRGKSLVTSENGSRDLTDRSKVRILLCDTDVESCQEIFTLLTQCSYQVTPAFTATDVFDALNCDGPRTDIILAEANLLMTNGGKILKYLKREKEFKQIPVIMMVTENEVSLVLKALGLGASDYLVKPLHNNALMNLWAHLQ
ncbi:unnamed protein product [Ilex paraguariensis]|uniref:Response regulatory domain-containing protein n=1 Tax=Ilex paraguariensis TaxID=185542 RepID=A0ABC8R0D2_9AQUA